MRLLDSHPAEIHPRRSLQDLGRLPVGEWAPAVGAGAVHLEADENTLPREDLTQDPTDSPVPILDGGVGHDLAVLFLSHTALEVIEVGVDLLDRSREAPRSVMVHRELALSHAEPLKEKCPVERIAEIGAIGEGEAGVVLLPIEEVVAVLEVADVAERLGSGGTCDSSYIDPVPHPGVGVGREPDAVDELGDGGVLEEQNTLIDHQTSHGRMERELHHLRQLILEATDG